MHRVSAIMDDSKNRIGTRLYGRLTDKDNPPSHNVMGGHINVPCVFVAHLYSLQPPHRDAKNLGQAAWRDLSRSLDEVIGVPMGSISIDSAVLRIMDPRQLDEFLTPDTVSVLNLQSYRRSVEGIQEKPDEQVELVTPPVRKRLNPALLACVSEQVAPADEHTEPPARIRLNTQFLICVSQPFVPEPRLLSEILREDWLCALLPGLRGMIVSSDISSALADLISNDRFRGYVGDFGEAVREAARPHMTSMGLCGDVVAKQKENPSSDGVLIGPFVSLGDYDLRNEAVARFAGYVMEHWQVRARAGALKAVAMAGLHSRWPG